MIGILSGCSQAAVPLAEGGQVAGIWRLDSYQSSDGSIDDAELVLEIDLSTAAVRGETVCHTVFGSLSVSDAGALSLTIPGTTNEPCDDNLQMIEDTTVADLESVTSWDRKGDQLTLEGPNQLVMEFRQTG